MCASTNTQEIDGRCRSRGFAIALAGVVLLGATAAALLLVPTACSSKKGNGLNVIVLMVDTLRADHLGCGGYERDTSPNLDRFAAGGVAFEAHFAQSSRTGPSVASVFTGLNVRTHGVLNPIDRWDGKGVLAPEHTTLAEILSGAGYRCRAVVSNPNVYGAYGFAQGFSDYLQTSIATDAGPINKRASEWIEAGGGGPFFLYLHYMEPHSPYAAPPALRRMFVDPAYRGPITGEHRQLDAILAGEYDPTAADRQRLVDLYDQEIASWDREFGRFLRFLQGKGLLENTVVVVLSDHGEEFFEHGGVLHGYTLYEEQLHVPLIVAAPGVEPRRVTSATRNIDVLPTLLDLLDLPVPDAVQGESLAALMAGEKEEDRDVLSETRIRAVRTVHLRALRTVDGWKMIEILVPDGTPPEIFRIIDDPAEATDLHGQDGKTDALLRQIFDHHLELVPEGEIKTTTLDEEALEWMREMGYGGGRRETRKPAPRDEDGSGGRTGGEGSDE